MCLRDMGAKTFGSSNGEQKGHYRAEDRVWEEDPWGGR